MKYLKAGLLLGTLLCALSLQAQFILTFNASDLDPYLGKRFGIRVTEKNTGREVGRKILPSLEQNNFSFPLYVLLQGRSYNVDFFVDVNANGSYDAPPADHAWRRMVVNAFMNASVNFSPDSNWTDTGFPDPFPYSQYNAVWGGKWRNLTFGSTDTIEAAFQVTCDSVFGYFMTKGVFGNPAPVEFNYAQPADGNFDPETDTITYMVPSPWTGEVLIYNGEIHGDLTLSGTGLQFTGTLGAQQLMCQYTVVLGGNPFANGYFYVRELNVISTAPELVVAGEVTNVDCEGNANGAITAIASGGTPDYTYAWSEFIVTPTITDLGPGTYTVTVTDVAGCIEQASFNITEPPALTTAATVLSPSCHGVCDGFVQIEASGGTPPYTYAWFNGNGGTSSSDLCAGQVEITVVDAAGCSIISYITIGEPDSLLIDSLEITQPSDGQDNGVIEVYASGGSSNYLYSLTGNVWQVSNVFEQLPPGLYCVYVMDNAGCEIKSDTFELVDITAVHELKADIRWYPNPVQDVLNIETDIPVEAGIFNVTGTRILQARTSLHQRISVDKLQSGTYILRLSNGNKIAYRKLVKV